MTTPNLIGQLADFAVSELEANKPAALQLIQQGEGGVEAAIVASIKGLPKPGGILGAAFPIIEASLEKFAATLVATYGPEVVFEFIDLQAKAFAKQLGG